MGEETAEVDIPDREAVMLGVIESLALVLDPTDTAGGADSEADKPPPFPTPSTNTIQNL